MNSKGQEEAPFELLIAVITMGFVLLIGLAAMHELEIQKCNNEIESKLEEFKTKLEIVINQKSPQLISFPRSSCYNPNDETIKIVFNDRPALCADSCSSGTSICRFLEYYNEKSGVSFRKCLNINPQTDFGTQENAGAIGSCRDLSASPTKEILIDLSERIPRGIYNLVNKETTQSFPIVCAYCKESSGCTRTAP